MSLLFIHENELDIIILSPDQLDEQEFLFINWRHTQKLRRHQPYKCDFYIYFIWIYFSEFLRYNYDQEMKNCLLQLENLLLNIKYVRARTFARANYVSYLSLTRIFTISRWLGGSRMGHYNEKRKSILYSEAVYVSDTPARAKWY